MKATLLLIVTVALVGGCGGGVDGPKKCRACSMTLDPNVLGGIACRICERQHGEPGHCDCHVQ